MVEKFKNSCISLIFFTVLDDNYVSMLFVVTVLTTDASAGDVLWINIKVT